MCKTIVKLIMVGILILNTGCGAKHAKSTPTSTLEPQAASAQKTDIKPNSVSLIYHKHEIPVLCYHRITDKLKSEYAVSTERFSQQMKILADSGFHSVSPNELYDYLVYNKELPLQPILITFDDSRAEHAVIAAPLLEKLGFRGTFFIMTITYDKKNYMTKDQLSALSKKGHTIGLHSWDHTMATKYKDSTDWQKQVVAPKKKLEEIVGKKVDYWAYPNGVFNHNSAEKLSAYFKLSFELSSKRDSLQPLQTVRRIIVPNISGEALLKSIRRTFK